MSHLDAPIDVVLLQTFYEVARLESVTAAARSLGRSQPAISHRLRALEADLGLTLFEFVGRRFRLTEFGRRLQGECADLLAIARRIRVVAADAQAVTGEVVIGTLAAVSSQALVPVTAELTQRHAELSLSFMLGLTEPLVRALRTGHVDILVLVGELNLSGLDALGVGVVRLVAAGAPGQLPSGGGPLNPRALAELRYLAWSGPSDPTFERVQRYAAKERLLGPTVIRIPHIESLRELAAAGAGFTILPDYAVREAVEAGRLVTRRLLGLEEEIPVWLVGRQGQVVGPALAAVRDALRGGLADRLAAP